MKNKMIGLGVMLLFLVGGKVFANCEDCGNVAFNLSEEGWATTHTARVSIGLDATLTNGQLATIHGQILQNLSKVVPGTEWHMTQFNRSQDISGLERLHVEAEARLMEPQLLDLHKRIQLLSRPGERYDILSIDFTPSLDELSQLQATLREKVYREVKGEILRLNQVYPNQRFYLNRIDFSMVNAAVPPPVAPVPLTAGMAKVQGMGAQGRRGVAVSNKVVISAYVTLASARGKNQKDENLPNLPSPTNMSTSKP
jgi:hypothetical protein